MMRREKSFTLVEIIVVVAIIAILASVSIPLMLRNRMTTNETVAITSCRTIVSACQSFYSVTIPHAYPPDIITLSAPSIGGPAYIDSALGSGTKSGYSFVYEFINEESFILYAEPAFPGKTGNRYFYTDQTGRITAKEGGRAGPNDSSIS